MERRRLGSSGLFVTAIGLGCDNFGLFTNAEDSIRIVHSALDLGIEYFDAADTYGLGVAEDWLGKALKGKRQQVIVGSKVGLPWGRSPNKSGVSRLQIMRQVDGSLRRLDTDYIDLYHLHVPDALTPIEESLRAMDDLVRQGKVRYLALSNHNAWQTCEAVLTAKMLHLNDIVACQVYYNLLRRKLERDLTPFCQKYGLGVVPYFPLEGGMLTGKYRRGDSPASTTRMARMGDFRRLLKDETFDTVEKLQQFCDQRGKPMAQLAIAWLLSQPQVACVIPGASTPEQLKANATAAEWRLTLEELAEVDKLAPVTDYDGFPIPAGRTPGDPSGTGYITPETANDYRNLASQSQPKPR